MSIQELSNRSKRNSYFSSKFGSMYDKLTGSSLELLGNLKGEVAIRKMMPSDEDDAKNMIRNSLLELGGVGVDSLYFDNDLEYLLETYSKAGSRIMLAVKNGEIIGTAAVKSLKCQDVEPIEGIGELNHFYMRTDFRGQGIGCRLLKRMLEEASAMGYGKCHATASAVFRDLSEKLVHCGFELSDLKVNKCEEEVYKKDYVKTL